MSPTHALAIARDRAWLLWLLCCGVVCLGYLWITDQATAALAYDAIAVASAVAILVGLLGHRPTQRIAWTLLAVGILLEVAGELVGTWLTVDGEIPFPSAADACYLVGYVALFLGLGRFFDSRAGGRGAMLETLVFVAAATNVLWVIVVDPIATDGTMSAIGFAVSMAYPLMDVLLVGLLFRVLIGSDHRHPSAFLLAAGFGLFLAADVVYSTLLVTASYERGLLDLGWLLGYALFGAAALHPAVRRRLRPAADQPGISAARVLVLGTAALVPLLTAIIERAAWGRVDPVTPILSSAVMFILVVVRLSGTLQVQRALLEERGVLQRSLEQQAFEDPLTSLLNRRGFVARVQGAVHREGAYAAVLFLDIDDFKAVNDSLGHAAGDEVMRSMGRRLRAAVRHPDAVARLGGDEFAILLDNCESPAVAMAFAERIRRALAAPIELQGLSLSVTVSIGVAIAAAGTPSGDALVREADLAAYHAKSAGKDRIELFDSDLDRELLRSIAIRNDVRRAVERGEFELRYQPIIDLATDQVESAEALLRWRHPTFGLLLPAEFLHEAEYSGQLVPIGRWVLREACATASQWRAQGHAVGVHVNVAPVQLAGGSLLADVRAALDASGLPPERLIVEVTESAIDEVNDAVAQFRTLEAWGVRLAIDDFGSGYSSLARVEALPVAELKFDRSLTVTNGRLLPALVRLSHSLDLRIIAEGIEDHVQLERARSLGIDAGQGYVFAQPLTARAFARHLGSASRRLPRPVLASPVSG